MNRRGFIALVGGVTAWSCCALAQQPIVKVWRIGFLAARLGPIFSGLYAAFVQGMRELGHEEHKDYVTEIRSAEGQYERFPELAKDLVEQRVDVLVTGVSAAIPSLQRATKTIPVVMVYSTDPVNNGFVASLAHPGGNITGLASSVDDTAPKQLELLATFLPKASLIGVLGNPSGPTYGTILKSVRASAGKLGLSVRAVAARNPEEINDAFVTFRKENVRAVIVASDAEFSIQRRQIAELSIRHHLPSIFSQREYPAAGGLMSYGENVSDFFHRAAYFVDQIFRGVSPADLPVEQPTQFHLVINRSTADKLEVSIPPKLYIFADEVIE